MTLQSSGGKYTENSCAEKTVHQALADVVENRPSGSSTFKFSPGRAMTSIPRSLSTLAAVVVGLGEREQQELYRYLYVFQQLSQRCRIAVITDTHDLKAIRPYGWLIEHLMDKDSYETVNPEADWSSYVVERVVEALDIVDAQEVLVASSGRVEAPRHNQLCRALGISLPYSSMY